MIHFLLTFPWLSLYPWLSVVIIFLWKRLNALTLTDVLQVQITAEHTSIQPGSSCSDTLSRKCSKGTRTEPWGRTAPECKWGMKETFYNFSSARKLPGQFSSLHISRYRGTCCYSLFLKCSWLLPNLSFHSSVREGKSQSSHPFVSEIASLTKVLSEVLLTPLNKLHFPVGVAICSAPFWDLISL